MVNSKQKGARGEREWAKVCKDHGYDCRRGQQYCGANGDADVIGLPYIHMEVKRVEKLNINEAMSQSCVDAMDKDFDYDNAEYGNLPIVAHRKNDAPWLVTMCAHDWFKLYQAYELQRSEKP